jgi:hypothetical protein
MSWVDYSFIMDVDGLLMNYLLQCPDTDIYVQEQVNLTPIFDPGTSQKSE